MSKKVKKKKKVGRKLFDGKPEKEVLQKLERVWQIDGSDEEACLSANISVSALQQYQKRTPEFLQRKLLIKKTLNLLSRQIIGKAIKNKDLNIAQWYLERKLPKEFSLKNNIELTGADGDNIKIENTMTDDDRQLLKNLGTALTKTKNAIG